MHAQERKRSEPTLASAIQDYLDFMAHEQHAARTTQSCYGSHLRRFARFIVERHKHDLPLVELTADDVREYLYSLSRKDLRPRTLRGMLYPVINMLALAVERGHLKENPAATVRLPKKDAAVRMTVSDRELTQLLSGVEREPDSFARTMNRAILYVFVDTAIRRQELLDLDVRDIDLDRHQLVVRSGKGSKRRVIPFPNRCEKALTDWLTLRNALGCAHEGLFVSDRRRRLGDVGIARIMERIRAMADLRDATYITPHAIRHAAATRMHEKGGDLRSIQQILGHNSLQTTAAYLHTSDEQMRRVVELATAGDLKETERRAPEEPSARRRVRLQRVDRRRR